MKAYSRFFIVGAVLLTSVSVANLASAGFLDRLNAATDKLNNYSQTMDQKSQQMQNASAHSGANAKNFEKTKTSNPITGDWGGQVTCAGANSATCGNGLDDYANCMHQTKGYYYRLVAENLQDKINAGGFSREERKDVQADLKSVKDAIETGNVVDADPNDQQRWFKRLSSDDQQEINRVNSKYMKEVHDDCESRFGGMSRYSSGK